MRYRIFAGGVALALVLAFLLPILVKLKEISLGAVMLIGFAMMARDLWESLRDRNH